MHFIKGISFKVWLVLVIVMTLSTVALMISYERSAERRLSEIDAAWELYHKESAHILDALGDLRGVIGYGKLIHNFKNYVLRRETIYLTNLEDNIIKFRESMNVLDGLLKSPLERSALQDIRNTIGEYIEKKDLAKSIGIELSAEELDKLVKIDDTNALRALDYLLDEAHKRRDVHDDQAGKTIGEAKSFLRMGYMLALLIIVMSGIMFFLILSLEKSWQAADAASRAKSSFLASMSHELRTPLNAVIGFAQMVKLNKDHSLSEKDIEHLNHIEEGGNQLLTLVNQVLDLSRVEAESKNIHLDPVSVHEMVHELMSMFEPKAKFFKVTMKNNLKVGRRVLADRANLRSVLQNLLSNAIKYNDEFGTVIVRDQIMPDGMVRVLISDTGPGIPANLHDKIFEPFDRLGREASNITGSGIGLSIAKRAVELMGGRIGVISTPGEGATFWIELQSD